MKQLTAPEIHKLFEKDMWIDGEDIGKHVTQAETVILGELTDGVLAKWEKEVEWILADLRKMLMEPVTVRYEHNPKNPDEVAVHVCTAEYCGHGNSIRAAMGDAIGKLLDPNLAYYYKAVQDRFKAVYQRLLDEGTIETGGWDCDEDDEDTP